MPDSREVFEHPIEHWDFLTASDDTEFEGQCLDRKEAGRVRQNDCISSKELDAVLEKITTCISAFANTNKSGSLLVIGISSQGEVKGISHLSDTQRSRLTAFNSLLLDQAAQAKFFECTNDFGKKDLICLVYVPYTSRRICQTVGNHPRAWVRQGSQNICLNQAQLEQLQRDKRVVDYEQADCCPYDSRDLDRAAFQEFCKAFLSDASYDDYSDEKILYDVGAINRDGVEYTFTNAGLLFFALNPQRVLPASFIRLVRFETDVENIDNRGLPTFDRKFTGSITKQIRDVRTFFRESGFFKLYQKRKAGGGFIEEPEYPFDAIDEAIVNAVAHREYAIGLPIECESYRNAFVVRNSGRLQQRDRDVPEQFSLETTRLIPSPRNPKLIEWLKMMRDERGAEFVRALSEGTRRMRDEMKSLGLPAPIYRVSESQTTVVLFNNSQERESALRLFATSESTEFSNLFPLTFVSESNEIFSADEVSNHYREIMAGLRDALANHDWYIDSFKFSKLIAHRQGIHIPLSSSVNELVRFYPAYTFQLRQYLGNYYLCVDYTLEVKNIRTAKDSLAYFSPDELIGRSAVVRWDGWERGKIISVDHEWTGVYLFDFKQEIQIASNKVIPNLSRAKIERLLKQHKIRFDLARAIKEHSLSLEPNSSRIRAEKTQTTATDLAQEIFPLKVNGYWCHLKPETTPLHRQSDSLSGLQVRSVPEPDVEFSHHRESKDIRDGITKFGAYSNVEKIIEIIPICVSDLRSNMAALIERLKTGKYKYRGSERTFKTRFHYSSIITPTSAEDTLTECRRLLQEHPKWIGDQSLERIFLVSVPKGSYSIDDEGSPYYIVKKFLLENGIPCQMIDTPTLINPDWKDLNLSLNIVSKCGVTPWVLPGAIPDADFFIGLSYTQSTRGNFERLMGYANVFDQYGKWQFYSGNIDTFPYSEKIRSFSLLIEQTLTRLPLSETPSIYFHYSAKFSREDRAAILEAARRIRPQGKYSFVWINSHHNVRLYDGRSETDGSLSRGSYVITSPNQIYLSTTGYNSYRKALGTPVMLEINVRVEYSKGTPNSPPDLRAVAAQILSLTKLNWGSTDSLCGEPITTKYAGDIAYLTSAFMRQGNTFHLHSVLERTPWFI
ncbi:RNA-binding domain-containing protein [Stenomitos frigidus]|uniref:Protein argonaute n=1 Tax=Stenomitos frigidus ULC18 TaxID=2107698 RepID=A0A2T1E1K4_9CYAN|nr:RNA-binding domain-containing protein [Stenomitos frigidus]PSB26636.1 transcriptional regulator [Stenomitos frigidus ULC18]